MNLEPAERMALAIHLNPGRYGVLIGAGVSSAAGIPDGWSVILDLVAKLATAKGVEQPSDPERWYIDTFGSRLEFGAILDELGLKETERRKVLAPYIEQGDSSGEEPDPSPSPAHREIAELARRGLVGVILTTNIDQLMERALTEASVEFDLVFSDAEFEGVQVSHRSTCLLAKLHGDYKHEGVRLTTAELESYPGSIRRFLRRTLPEYGFIFCGWSARWDKALGDALARTPCRKHSSFWLTRSLDQIPDEARDVISSSGAIVVPIGDADQALHDLSMATAALEASRASSPDTLEILQYRIHQYVRSAENYPRLSEMLLTEVDTFVTLLNRENESWEKTDFNDDSYRDRLQRTSELASRIIRAVSAVAKYSTEHTISLLWNCISRIGAIGKPDANNHLRYWQRYSAMLALYAVGIVVVSERRFTLLRETLLEPEWWDERQRRIVPGLELLNSHSVFSAQQAKTLPADDSYYWWSRPSHFIGDTLYPLLGRYFPNETAFRHTLDIFEFVQSLVEFENSKGDSPLPGQFALWADYFRKGDLGADFSSPIGRFYQKYLRYPDCALLAAGFFGGLHDRLSKTAQAHRGKLVDFVGTHRG